MRPAPTWIELYSSMYIEERLREAEMVRPKLPRPPRAKAKRTFVALHAVAAWIRVHLGRRQTTTAAGGLSSTRRPVEPGSSL
jgi:hypothetical protein